MIAHRATAADAEKLALVMCFNPRPVIAHRATRNMSWCAGSVAGGFNPRPVIAHRATSRTRRTFWGCLRFNPRPVIAHRATCWPMMRCCSPSMFQSAPGDRSPGDGLVAEGAALFGEFQSAPGDRSPGDSSASPNPAPHSSFNPRPVIAHRATRRGVCAARKLRVSIRAR